MCKHDQKFKPGREGEGITMEGEGITTMYSELTKGEIQSVQDLNDYLNC